MTQQITGPFGESVIPPGASSASASFEDELDRVVHGIPTEVQATVRDEVLPIARDAFKEAGHALAADVEISMELMMKGLHAEFILPRWIPLYPDKKPFRQAEEIAQHKILAAIIDCIKSKAPHLDFKNQDPTGAKAQARARPILFEVWSAVRQEEKDRMDLERIPSQEVEFTQLAGMPPLMYRLRNPRFTAHVPTLPGVMM